MTTNSPARRRADRRRRIALFAVLALAVRLALPPGFMPGGEFVVLCTGDGPTTIFLAADGSPATPQKDGDTCSWQGLASSPALTAWAIEVPVLAPPADTGDPATAAAVHRHPDDPAHPVRGPPRLLA